MTGRPSKLTPAAIDAFVQATRLGATRDLAAAAAGWSPSAAHRYLADGRAAQQRADDGARLTAKERRFRDFWEAVQKAEGEMARNCLAAIVRAAQQRQHWTAAAWLLERRFPDAYGRRMIEVVGKDGGPVEVEVTAGELLDELRRLNDRSAFIAEWSERLAES